MAEQIKSSWTLHGLMVSAALKAYSCTDQEISSLAVSIAKSFSLSGSPVPWLGIIQDLCSFIVSVPGANPEEGFNKSIFQNDVFADYQDMVLARWQQDDGLRRIQKAVSGRALKRKVEAILHIFEFWIQSNFIEPAYANSGMIVALEADGFRLGKKAIESVEHSGWPFELIKILRTTVKAFRFASQITDQSLIEMIEKGFDAFEEAPRFQLRQILHLNNQLQVSLTENSFVDNPQLLIRCQMRDCSGQISLGGYQSISKRGPFESLIPSQLVYFDENLECPNLLASRHEAGELLYYRRGENGKNNAIHICIFLSSSLLLTRTKEINLPCQTLTAVYSFIYNLWINLRDNHGFGAKLSIAFADWKMEAPREIQMLEKLFCSDIELEIVKVNNLDCLNFQELIKPSTTLKNIPILIRKNADEYSGRILNFKYNDIIVKECDVFLNNDFNVGESLKPWPQGWAFTMGRLIETIRNS
ncbi:MAG: hypothetical protein ACKO9Z_13195 [Planctomycetota bacterium]